MDAADHRCFAEIVRRGNNLGVDKLKQEMFKRDSHAVCIETHIAKLNRINLMKRPNHAANLTNSGSGVKM